MFTLLASAQAIVLAPSDPDRVIIDIAVPAPCPGENDKGFEDEILVCARRDGESPHRISGEEAPGAENSPRAELLLPDGTTLSAETESAELGMARSQRLMVRWKLKF